GQAITVLVSPVLTRLYSPEDFGVLAVYSSILGILSVVASWRYELAIPLPEKDEDAINLLALSLGIVVLMSLLVSFGLWHLSDQIVRWAKVPALRPYVWLLPIGLLLVGSYQVFNYWAVRKHAFSSIARTKLYQGFGTAFSQIGGGFLTSGPLGLIIGQIVGQCAGIITLVKLYRNHENSLEFDFAKCTNLAKRYRRFPMLSTWPAFVNAVGTQLPVIALSAAHGTQVTGWFSLAIKVFAFPLSIISVSTSQVLMGQAATYKRLPRELQLLFWKVIRQQCLLGLPLLLLIPINPVIFPLIFGQEWRTSGIYAAIWLPSLVATFIATPTGAFLDVLERQDIFLLREAFRVAILGGVAAVSVLLKVKPLIMLSMLSGATVIFAFIYAWLSLYAIKREG
ncbi:lipopolysaccharide biosynthesis protein, partial [Thermanaerothrix sp.]